MYVKVKSHPSAQESPISSWVGDRCNQESHQHWIDEPILLQEPFGEVALSEKHHNIAVDVDERCSNESANEANHCEYCQLLRLKSVLRKIGLVKGE